MTHGLIRGLLLAVAMAMVPMSGKAAESPYRDARLAEVQRSEVQRKEPFWRNLAQSEPRGDTGSRQIMGYALALAETRQHPERLDRLFDLLAQMQDRDPGSKTYGNLRWRWQDTRVNDPNAAEFCMHDALLLWLRHRDWISVEAQRQLLTLMQVGLEGVLRHRVPTTYTNIAMTRAANLIVLGEVLGRREVAAEGQRRLDELMAWTSLHGIREVVSPTYYGIDLNALTLIVTEARGQRARSQADALLRLLWTDIALNWFPASERLSGAYSRTYDYLSGRGALDWHLWVHGWFHSPTPGKAERVEPYASQWVPPPGLQFVSRQQLPRLVRQSWGDRYGQSRTSMVYRDVGLSTLGAGYGPEDVPLAIDLPGTRDAPRGYFIADGHQDPYGKKKHVSGAGRQMKATHLTPFWIAAQRTGDTLAAALYDPKSLDTDTPQSHLVLPRNAQSITIDGVPADLARRGATASQRIRLGQAVVFRYGTAAVGVRLLAATTRDGRTAEVGLVDDGNPYGCLRLTVEHGAPAASGEQTTSFPLAAAAIWVRVGSQLYSDTAFTAWQRAFEAAQPAGITMTGRGVAAEVPGTDGPVAFSVGLNGERQPVATRIVPEPSRGVLELDGKEIGRPMLAMPSAAGADRPRAVVKAADRDHEPPAGRRSPVETGILETPEGKAGIGETLKGMVTRYILHLDQTLGEITQAYGLWTYGILFLVIFCETGLVVTPFLPGDSLLFAVGALCGTGALDLFLVLMLLTIAAIAGDTVNYWIGACIGPRALSGQLRFLKKEHLDRTHAFYERHGGKTIILARFIPIIRTFAPFVAGVGAMNYRKFILYNVLGGIAWVGIFVGAGYWFGQLEGVRKNFTYVILAIVVLSVLPVVIEYLRTRFGKKPVVESCETVSGSVS